MPKPSHPHHAGDSYLEGPPRQVPGFESLHRMTHQLLSERVPADGRMLVLGAGGGLELKALAEAESHWSFDGVDPSSDMLQLAAQTTAPFAERIDLHEGTMDIAPNGPFDGATALLTFHFIPRDQRIETLKQIHARLKRGAPLILAHLSFAQTEPERSLWINRHLTYGGTPPERMAFAIEAMKTRLTIVDPKEDEAMLHDAGFSGVELFHAGLAIRGWVAYA